MVAEATVAGAVLPAADKKVLPLTARQAEVLGAIRGLTAARGFPPSVRELMDALGIRSTNGVTDHLRALARKGVLRLTPKVARGIALLPGVPS
jgi:repressor LexA